MKNRRDTTDITVFRERFDAMESWTVVELERELTRLRAKRNGEGVTVSESMTMRVIFAVLVAKAMSERE